jgi:hypothetical protein
VGSAKRASVYVIFEICGGMAEATLIFVNGCRIAAAQNVSRA